MPEPVPASVPFPELLAAFRDDPLSLIGKVPGIWLFDKPPGPSSNLVVVRSRKIVGTKKIGHAGTLDPMAEGLLVLLAGNATRLFDAIQEFPKTYRAGFVLGQKTDSQDATGTPLPGWAPSRPPPLARAEVEEALAAFRGEVVQVPPMHSALKKDGQPLYKLARRGVEVERAGRPGTVYALELAEFDGARGTLDLTVSKGFYVRTLINDLGDRLGAGGVMTSLVRTAVGPFRLEDAAALEELGRRREDARDGVQ